MSMGMADQTDELLAEIETFLAETSMTPTAFGREALRDPVFVFKLRDGREPRRDTRQRARQAMRRLREKLLHDAAQ
jgi:homoserine dehydrogenase